jgi:hypothetical protein
LQQRSANRAGAPAARASGVRRSRAAARWRQLAARRRGGEAARWRALLSTVVAAQRPLDAPCRARDAPAATRNACSAAAIRSDAQQQRKQERRFGAPASARLAQSPEPHPQSWRLRARRTD